MNVSAIDLSVVIVSWNTRDLLVDCLRSINTGRGELKIEVIVVDGGSVDGSPEMVAGEFPWVRLEARPENVGFPKGNNIGLALAKGRLLLLLNPDTKIIGEALSMMIGYMDANPDIGVLGPMLLNPDGSIQSSRRRFPTLATGLFESTWFQPFAPRSLLDNYYAADLSEDTVSDVDWLVGACFMTRRQVVDQVGPLDEAYFMYSEELDWCRRVKEGGWRVVFLPEAQVMHHVGKSSDQAITERHINYQRAKLRYFRKFHGRSSAAILRFALLFNYLFQVIIEGAKGILGFKRALRWQRVRAYWAVLRTGLRPAGY